MNIIFITANGKQKIEKAISEKEKRIREIQKEKEVAYELSGDGWHDNPGFNNLTLLEEREMNELYQLKSRVANAKVWDKDNRNCHKAEIGSIIKIKVENLFRHTAKEMVFEIAGSGESDLNNNLIAYDTPIGLAVLNMKKGEEKETRIPAGKVVIKLISFFEEWNEVDKHTFKR